MRARLSFQDFEDKVATIELTSDEPATIGRSRDNNVVIRDEHASRLHARIHFDRGQWFVRDFGLNGTKLNGVRIDQEAALRHGDEVRIGDTRMRFTEMDASVNGPSTKRIVLAPAADPPPSTRLQHDDLTVLCNFMAAAVRETDTQALLHHSLDVVLHQTSASLVAFLSPDPNEPVTKMIVPETAKVDPHLSKQLNKRTLRDGKPVWLSTDVADTRAPDAPNQLSDALCLPVQSAIGRSLGTLHVYRHSGYFAERDLRFCEALVIYLANELNTLRVQKTLRAENSRLRGRAAANDLVGNSDAMRELRSVIARVAPRSATVLIRGEPGTDKESVAVALHRLGGRSQGPLVTVSGATTPTSLLEAELFGYYKGSFSGAESDHDGYLLQADEGTLYLHEIADLSTDCQAKLLRVIDGKPFRQLGGTQDLAVSVRIVAATARDLEQEVKDGRFLAELYERLKVVTIDVPALRRHCDDVPVLVQYFLDKLGTEHRRQYRLTEAALERLTTFDWPGNVRQLRSVVDNAATLADSDLLDICDFRLEIAPDDDSDLPISLEKLEAWAVKEALKRSGGNKTRAAQLLGIGRDALYAKISLYHLEKVAMRV